MKTLLLFAFAFAVPASADDPNLKTGPCAADIEKLCKGVQSGQGRIMRCLHNHKDQVSEACKKDGEEKRAAVKNMREACKDDVKKFCKKGRGPKALHECLQQNDAQLSEGCKAAAKALGPPSGS